MPIINTIAIIKGYPFALYYIVLKLYLFQPPVRPAIPRDYRGVQRIMGFLL